MEQPWSERCLRHATRDALNSQFNRTSHTVYKWMLHERRLARVAGYTLFVTGQPPRFWDRQPPISVVEKA